MYDWLAGALREASIVLTANRRLARALHEAYAHQQTAAERSAWRTPAVYSWRDWVRDAIGTCTGAGPLPVTINSAQSRLLWERCLRREVADPLVNCLLLARQAHDTWGRLQEWNVSAGRCLESARNRDQRTFAKAALSYESILAKEGWVDPAGMPTLAARLIRDGHLGLPTRIAMAGFDRVTPQLQALIDRVASRNCEVRMIAPRERGDPGVVYHGDNRDAEMRAAGAWAREQLQQTPTLRIAIVAPDLADYGLRYARLVKEGLAPGWQLVQTGHDGIVNVSYGQTLTRYPVISVALLVLRWSVQDLPSEDLGVLLRSSMLETALDAETCTRLELRLRQLPAQTWSPERFLEAFRQTDGNDAAEGWRKLPRAVREARHAWEKKGSPANWARRFDALLALVGWPGPAPLDSAEFQLVNRWRNLLNDLASLDRVSQAWTAAGAHGRLEALGAEIVFQPEASAAAVQLLGPLEAAGMEFDRLWVAGASAANWPPPTRPLTLVARDLQREFAMPDSTPADTLNYARRVLGRLMRCADSTVVSYPLADGAAEQTPSALLDRLDRGNPPGVADPSWHAARLANNVALQVVADRVPVVSAGERLAGGAATIARQLQEPFAAFALGRLGARALSPFTPGLAANVRGNLIHGALQGLYADTPSSGDIARWDERDIRARCHESVHAAFRNFERHADPVVLALLQMERQRVAVLLQRVIEHDKTRGEFALQAVEKTLDARFDDIVLHLRIDRIDRIGGGAVMIIDYKTGQTKKFLQSNGTPADWQLVVYAAAHAGRVGGLGLMNVDSRAVRLYGASRTLTPDIDWDTTLRGWLREIDNAAAQIAAGDVRINPALAAREARRFALLSRYQELIRA